MQVFDKSVIELLKVVNPLYYVPVLLRAGSNYFIYVDSFRIY